MQAKPIFITLGMGHKAIVRSFYDPDLLPIYRDHAGTWNKKHKVWEYHCLRVPALIESLQKAGCEVNTDENIFRFLNELRELQELSRAHNTDASLELPDALYPFQRVGVEFGIRTAGRCIIADEQGLGKTVEALMILRHFSPSRTLIVAPASVLENWRRETKHWLNEDAWVVKQGKKKNDATAKAQICIVSYDLLQKIEYQPEMLILDEAHYIRNQRTTRTKSVLDMSQRCKMVIALTGTPVLNRPAELWPIWQAVQPSTCPGWWAYARRYCDATKTEYGWDVGGATNTTELTQTLRTFMLRRKKTDVMKELPAIIRRVVPLRPNTQSKLLRKLRALAKSGQELTPLTRVALMGDVFAEFTANAERKATLPEFNDYIRNTLEQNSDKMVIFAKHHTLIQAITGILDSCQTEFITLTGKTRRELRQPLIDRFNQDKNCRVAVLSLGVGCEGLNLQSASQAIIAELDWSPSILAQAESRLHRIGQSSVVEITYLLYGRFEDRLYALLANKSGIIMSTVDGDNDTTGSIDLLEALLNSEA